MLKVYKSSAGAGKTFTLAGNYIDLLFSHATNNGYKRILAVTFTKKATAEMKGRIVRELALLSRGQKSNYAEALKEKHHLTDQQLQLRAQLILIALLQDYSNFFVTTIDSFFQQILRSFARELNLPGAYNLELDSKYVVQKAVDDYFFNLPGDIKSRTVSMLLQLIREKMDDDKSADLRTTILGLGSQLLNEAYQLNAALLQDALQQPDALSKYSSKLKNIQKTYLQQYRQLEKQMQVALLGADESIFQRGVLSPFHFGREQIIKAIVGEQSIANFLKFVSDPLKMLGSQYKKDPAAQAAALRIHLLAKQLLALLDGQSDYVQNFVTASAILKNLPYLDVLKDLQYYIAKANDELNRLPIAETNSLLYDVVSQQEDSPFIYDKIGTRISNYMIDEFQDTSNMQWRNFRPLIAESLAGQPNGENMLVGDIKQSIYRWRNSDYTTLQYGVKHDFPGVEDKDLVTNWRSDRQIIDSNNHIFALLSSKAQEVYNHRTGLKSSEITDIYSSVVQEKHEEELGYVRIQFLPDEERKEQTLLQLPQIVSDIQQRGVKLGSVAILIRNNSQAKPIADCLLEAGIKVMSNEALLLNQSLEVSLLLNMLRLSLSPDDKLLRFLTSYQYKLFLTSDSNLSLSSVLNNQVQLPQLPAFNSLQEQVTHIVRTLGLNRKPSSVPYILAFQDKLYQYTQRYSADLYSFLTWWDERSENFAIQTQPADDAVQIMTLHKSKGLEFDVVILPFCDWDSAEGTHTNLLWLKPQSAPFSDLPVVPVAMKQELLYSDFHNDYLAELCKLYIDNLNLTYVAFTRAKRELYVFAPRPKPDSKKKADDGQVSPDSIRNMGQMLYAAIQTELIGNIYERGEKVSGSREKKESSETYETIPLSSPDIQLGASLQVKLPSRDYLRQDSLPDLHSRVNMGTLMHDILCSVVAWGDETPVIQTMLSEGKLTADDLLIVNNEIAKLKRLTASTDWFSSKWKVINEHDIILPDGSVRRPDRLMICGNQAVVVDWKFGLNQPAEHTSQVREYISLMQQMGYQTTGFLCYAALNQILPVSPTC